MQKENTGKVVIIGAGNVGESICLTFMLSLNVKELVLIDINADRAKGAALDIGQGAVLSGQTAVRQGDYAECADADVIVVTAGVARKPGQSRLDLAKTNVAITREIACSINKYAHDPIILVVSNPVDVNTYIITKETGFPASKIIGSGTLLDSARFQYQLGRKFHMAPSSIAGYVLGEHGDSQVTVWSSVKMDGKSPEDFLPKDATEKEQVKSEIEALVKNGGAEIIGLRGVTNFGIAVAAKEITEAVLQDKRVVMPVSHVLPDGYGKASGVPVSLPCTVGKGGIMSIEIPAFTPKEEADFELSAKTLKTFIENIGI